MLHVSVRASASAVPAKQRKINTIFCSRSQFVVVGRICLRSHVRLSGRVSRYPLRSACHALADDQCRVHMGSRPRSLYWLVYVRIHYSNMKMNVFPITRCHFGASLGLWCLFADLMIMSISFFRMALGSEFAVAK